MHDVTDYKWVPPGAAVDAATLASLRGPDGELAVWLAETPHAEAMSAPVGKKDTAIKVYANHGRWIAECPDCGDAQLAAREDRRFMCVGCANVAVGGVWRPVTWPRNLEALEEILDARPSHLNRNWSPGETIADLIAEASQSEEPTTPREHAIWAGLSVEDAEQWERDCIAAAEWLRAVEEEGA